MEANQIVVGLTQMGKFLELNDKFGDCSAMNIQTVRTQDTLKGQKKENGDVVEYSELE